MRREKGCTKRKGYEVYDTEEYEMTYDSKECDADGLK
jgi:hypothetical protein